MTQRSLVTSGPPARGAPGMGYEINFIYLYFLEQKVPLEDFARAI